MILWTDYRLRLLRVLDDLDRSAAKATWTDDDLLDYVNDGLRFLAQYEAAQATVTATLAVDTSTYSLPADCLALGPVIVTGSSWRRTCRPVKPKVDSLLPDLTAPTNPAAATLTYTEWPSGTLAFTPNLPAGVELAVNYYAYWPEVTVSGSSSGSAGNSLTCPRWMYEPLKWYCLAQAMAKPGASAASLGQYKTRTDAGGPEDNPLLEYGRYCEARYKDLLTEQRYQDRTGW